MKLIERYIFAVTERLPENTREDVGKELRTNIEDMLPENPTEKDIRTVLERLGNPNLLANEYNPVKKYFIGPSLYDSYITVLKLVTGIVASVFASITLFAGIFTSSSDGGLLAMSIGLFVDILVAVIEGIGQAFMWVTLTFFIMERAGSYEGSLTRKKWSLDDLPTLSASSQRKISRGQTILSMIGLIFFTAILYLKPELIGMYGSDGGRVTLIAPILVKEELQAYIPIILLLAAFEFGLLVWKFIARRWTSTLAMANILCNLVLCVLIVVMINDQTLYNQEFIFKCADLFDISQSQMMRDWVRSLSIFTVAFILISIWDGIDGLLRSKK